MARIPGHCEINHNSIGHFRRFCYKSSKYSDNNKSGHIPSECIRLLRDDALNKACYSTISLPIMSSWPVPQKTEQMKSNSPVWSAVNVIDSSALIFLP